MPVVAGELHPKDSFSIQDFERGVGGRSDNPVPEGDFVPDGSGDDDIDTSQDIYNWEKFGFP